MVLSRAVLESIAANVKYENATQNDSYDGNGPFIQAKAPVPTHSAAMAERRRERLEL